MGAFFFVFASLAASTQIIWFTWPNGWVCCVFFFYNLWFQLACSLPCLRMLKASEDYYQRLPLAPLKWFWSEIFLDHSQSADKSSWIIYPPALPPSFNVSLLLFCLLQLTASFSHSTVPRGWFFFFFQPRLTCDGGRQIQLKWRGEGGSTQQCPLRWLNVFHVLWWKLPDNGRQENRVVKL